METSILTADKDPMGTAIADYFNHHKADRLCVFLHSLMKMKYLSGNSSVI